MYVAALSYGKDSIAMLEVIHRLGLPLDRVVTVDEWATDTLQALLPEVVEFQHKADVKIYDRYGIAVEHVRSPHTFESLFYGIMSDRSNRAGEIRGWPFQRGCWANSFLKIEPFRKAIGRCDVQYIGIAANETLRIKHHFNVSKKRTVKMPLVNAGWTEKNCYKWCKENNLLSPVYKEFFRDGCWFCCNNPVERQGWLRKEHPELWELMLKWDKDSPVQFKAHYSVSMLERRFAAEDAGQVPVGNTFRWKMLEK